MPAQIVVRRDGERLHIAAPFSFRLTCKGLPGALWHPKRKTWHVPSTPTSAANVWRAFKHESLDLDDATKGLLSEARKAMEARANKDATDLPEIPGAKPSWLHQRQAYHFAADQHAAMLAMDMGTGKSKTAISLLEGWDSRVVLILAPKNAIGVWPAQFETHAAETWEVVAPSTKLTVARRAGSVDAALRLGTDGRRVVVIVNYEAAWRGGMNQLILGTEWDAVILDESHRIKAAGGKASLFANRLRERAGRRLCLTGTPMPHSPLDIYAQYRFLDPGVFGSSANRFKHRYAVMGGYENRQVVEWVNQDELAQKFASVAFTCRAEDVLDLPEFNHVTREIELESKTMRTYKQLEDQLIAEIEEGVVTAGNALTKLLRLQQVTSGYVKTDEDQIVDLGLEKAALLADLLEDFPKREPIVIFSRFTHDLDCIARAAEDSGRNYGELSGRRRDGLTDDAKMSPDIDILGVQIQAGGVGIDLTRARYAIYYSLGFSLGDYMQSLKRLHRPGQAKAVTYYHLLAKDTVDQKVYKALAARQNVVESIINPEREHATEA